MRSWVVALALVGASGGVAIGQEKPLPARIREANLKATKAIAARWSKVKPGQTTYEGHARTLVALALLRAGGPEERTTAKKLLDEWWLDAVAGRFGDPANPNGYGTYVVALGISALEAQTLEAIEDDTSTLTRYKKTPVPEDLKKRLEIATKALLDSSFSEAAGWGYQVRPFGKDGRGGGSTSCDLSNTQFAALALHDAARGGVKIPAETVDALVEYMLPSDDEAKNEDAAKGVAEPRKLRWSYITTGSVRPSNAMTFAALSMLAIARSLGAKDARVEPTITRGLVDVNKLVRTLGPAVEGEHGWGSAYLLYSLEKALDLLEIELLDGKDWFAPIAERVLKAQGAKGLWGDGDLIDSCLYVLFLQRASFGASRLGARTVVRATPESDALGALRSFGDTPNATTRANAEAMLARLAASKDGREALALSSLVELSKKGATREVANKALRELCGKEPSGDELKVSIERLDKLRGPAPEAADLRAAFEKTTLLPVRAYAAQRASPDLLVEGAAALHEEAILETKAGSRCAHALEAALRKTKADLPALTEDVRPAELRHFVKVARERK